MSGKVDYFVAEQAAPLEARCILVPLNARMVPAAIQGLVRYSVKASWVSAQDWYRGYQETAEMMEGLLMDCGEVLINNIVALRGIDPAAPRDETTGVPLAPPQGSTLLDIFSTFQGPRGTPGEGLDAIATAAEQTRDATAQGLGIGEDPEDLVLLAQLLAVL